MIVLKLLNKEKLQQFIHSEEYRNMPVLPISYHRAISHINNPRAQPDDVLLILVYENNDLLGYLGILPDDCYVNETVALHAGWLSCIWVSPLARGKGIAKKMVLAAYEAYKNHILITNFTDEAYHLYVRLNIFNRLPDLKGYRIYRTACLSKILPKRYEKLSKFNVLFSAFDNVVNVLWKPILKTKIDKSFEYIPIELNELDELSNTAPYPWFNRQKREFEWIMKYPWIKQVNTLSPEAAKYHFSSEEYHFESAFIKIIYHNRLLGYLFYILRNGHLKIPYFFPKEQDIKLLSLALSELIVRKNPDYITLFFPKELIKHVKTPFLFKKKTIRRFMISKALYEKIKQFGYHSLTILDGDGDAAFT